MDGKDKLIKNNIERNYKFLIQDILNKQNEAIKNVQKKINYIKN
jgi:hypothetical protein